jgi:transglutaminase-like putative cysteine protease
MGLASRYVSGYLRTNPPPGKPRLVGADASHAWTSCWCGPLGWIDIDTTNDCFVGDSYVTIAWGRDYGDLCPIQGVFIGGGEHRIEVSVDMSLAANS